MQKQSHSRKPGQAYLPLVINKRVSIDQMVRNKLTSATN